MTHAKKAFYPEINTAHQSVHTVFLSTATQVGYLGCRAVKPAIEMAGVTTAIALINTTVLAHNPGPHQGPVV